ncbi:LRR receptor-like serine/threonine-protein kinase IOS1 isoform X2 [Elaeis guineensis]|uniref:LRR receptor-like serine/threonine-protein kinase IOS1 isoform X2 n=1 Tax=Elaeis guineensis var. tenera TaxID=51953 RepID=UPI003C6CF19C
MMGILIQIVFLAATAFGVINGQEGFVSIDCGMDAGGGITDNITGIVYQPDAQFIDTGINYKISKSTNFTSWYPPQVETLRSFPDGDRNCYTIDHVNQGEKYLVRAFFMYGNYDGRDSASIGSPLLFDLHLGVNYWKTLNITNTSRLYPVEIITVAKDDYFSVCLVKTGSGTPFISLLELRLINDVDVYKDVNQSNSLVLFTRLNVGGSGHLIRYPNDTYDRIWWTHNFEPLWLRINTSETIQIIRGDAFKVPSIVMSSAVTPSNNTILEFYWDSQSGFVRPSYCIYMHFAEFDYLPPNRTRLIDVIMNGQVLKRNFQPTYLLSTHIPLTYELGSSTRYQFNITKAADSILPPILNAIELYSTLLLPNLASDRTDVRAMMDLKQLYDMKIWQGDACAPQDFTWKGILCTFSSSNPPRVTSINLSSLRLTGNIPNAIDNLKAIEYLDLSNNNFTGPIPNFLSGLNSLRMLNLSNNQLNGSIPKALRQKQENGFLETENNPGLCTNGNECVDDHGKKKTLATAVIVVIAVILASLILLAIIVVVVRRQRRRKTPTPPSPIKLQPEKATSIEDQAVLPENRGFTFLELKTITNNFERVLGKGGFGIVYYGRLRDGTEVAVKLRAHTVAQESMFSESQIEESDSKAQRIKEFQAEALLLSRVHHRNLVSLIGYCKDNNCLGLVYEFVAQGNLKNHLTDKDGTGRVLNWRERLRIAVDAALGLEYLHRGCAPPIIHRDVKTSNILLSQNLVAKIADFGLSKAFLTDDHTHVSTEVVVGTLGYMDPEYHDTFQLNEKSDIYSFGVVLLELITSLPAVLKNPDRGHIVQWVQQQLAKGEITDVVDVGLKGEYNINSIWKVIDTAMKCTMPTASQRPTMTQVVIQLKESLQLEVGHERAQNIYVEVLEQTDSTEIASIDMKTTMSGPTAR